MKRLLCVLFIVVLFFPAKVTAQDDTLDRLTADYFFQLEQYRSAESKFNLDKAEYRQLETLVSRDKAITSLKEAVIARDLVMESYLATLEHILTNQPVIETSEKEAVLAQIRLGRSSLQNHRQSVPELFQLEAANAKADEFSQLMAPITQAQYMAYSLIAISRLENVTNDLSEYTSTFQGEYVDPLTDANTKRFATQGITDIQFQLELTRKNLESATQTYSLFYSPEVRRRPAASKIYSDILENLQPTLTSNNKAISFLRELNRQLN